MPSKTLTTAVVVGVLATTGFADNLMAGTAIPTTLPPPAVKSETATSFPWEAGDDTYYLFKVDGKRKRGECEGGEGGEGGGCGARIMMPAPEAVAVPIPVGCGSHQTIGVIIGGVTGAAVGNQFGKGNGKVAATALGALIGVFAGQAIGAQLDAGDAACAESAAGRAFAAPIGTTIDWTNPDTGAAGTVRSTREGKDRATGQYCREYQQTVVVGGQKQQSYGTACRQPDGNWRITS